MIKKILVEKLSRDIHNIITKALNESVDKEQIKYDLLKQQQNEIFKNYEDQARRILRYNPGYYQDIFTQVKTMIDENKTPEEIIKNFFNKRLKYKPYNTNYYDYAYHEIHDNINIGNLLKIYIVATSKIINNQELADCAKDKLLAFIGKSDEDILNSSKFKLDLSNAINKAEKDEAEYNATDVEQYKPTARDWNKMIGYMNKKSDPWRLADSCKDSNKVVARYIIAKALGWEKAATAFRQRILDLGILTDNEIKAYADKYRTYNIPDEYRDLIQDLVEYDKKGGLAINQQDTNQMNQLKAFPSQLIKALDDSANIEEYKIVSSNASNKVIEITNYNEEKYYLTVNYYRRGYGYRTPMYWKFTLTKPGEDKTINSCGSDKKTEIYKKVLDWFDKIF